MSDTQVEPESGKESRRKCRTHGRMHALVQDVSVWIHGHRLAVTLSCTFAGLNIAMWIGFALAGHPLPLRSLRTSLQEFNLLHLLATLLLTRGILQLHDRAVGDVLHRRDAAGPPPHPDGGLHLHARRDGPGTAAVRRHRPTAAGHSGGGPHPFRAQPADAGRGRDDGGQRVHPPPVEAAHPSDRLCVHYHGCDVQR